jgi:hypothetical protein
MNTLSTVVPNVDMTQVIASKPCLISEAWGIGRPPFFVRLITKLIQHIFV